MQHPNSCYYSISIYFNGVEINGVCTEAVLELCPCWANAYLPEYFR